MFLKGMRHYNRHEASNENVSARFRVNSLGTIRIYVDPLSAIKIPHFP